jgi:cytochrome c553
MSWRRGIFVRVVVLGSISLGTLHAQKPGAAIFAANCAGCHGADGRGGEHAPNIATAPEVQHLMDRELPASFAMESPVLVCRLFRH